MAETNSATQDVENVPDWPLRLPVALYVVWLCAMVLIPTAAFLVSRALHGSGVQGPPPIDENPVLFALINLGSGLLAWLVVFRLVRVAFRPHRWPTILHAIGVRRPTPLWANVAAIPIGAVSLVAAIALLSALGAADTPSGYDAMMKTPITAAALIVFAITVAPITEEFFFRGLFFPPIARFVGAAGAVVIVAAVFVAPHLSAYRAQPLQLAGIALFALVAGTLRAWTGSIVPSTLAHIAFNGTSFILYYATGQTVS